MKDRTSPHLYDDTPRGRVNHAGVPNQKVKPAVFSQLRVGRIPARLRQRLGALLLVAVIVAVIVATMWPDDSPTPITGAENITVVKGYGGELKKAFLTDPEVTAILAEKYGLHVDITSRGSIELACGMPLGEDVDFVWLGDAVALARYTDRGCAMLNSDNIYNSPVVLYSWAPVADALVAAGVAKITADGAYTLDFTHLVDLMKAGTTWADIGLTQLNGRIVVQTTDPTKSNSGLLFAGMLANTLNGGDVVNATTVTPLLPDIQTYFQRLGLMQPTSGDLFDQFLITGMGAMPIVALYESQIPEFLDNNPSYREQIEQQVRVLYPQPTVWATHPLVVRNDNANRLLAALKDPDIQRLAWEHGQRPGVPSVVVDPDVIPVPGILREVESVTSMPALEAVDLILAAVAAPPPGGTPVPTFAPLVPIATLSIIGQSTLTAAGRRRRSPKRRPVMFDLNLWRTAARQRCLLMVILGLLAPGTAVAQVTEEAAIALIVVWTAPFEERTDVRTVPAANHETVLSNENNHIVVVNGTFAPADARLSALEALGADPDTLVSVDAGTEGSPQYWLDLLTIEGTPYGAFTLGRTVDNGATLTLFLGPVTTFADGMAQSQEVVLVDGDPLFDGVDPLGLQTLLEARLSQPDVEGPAGEGAPNVAEATATAGEDAQPSTDASGLVGERIYVSPQYKVTLTWSDAWVLDPAFEEPVTSDVNFDIDQVYLTVNSPQWVWITFAAAGTQGLSFADVFRSVSDQSYVTQYYGETGELVVSRMGINADGHEVGAFIVRATTPEGYDLLAYEEWRLTGDGNSVVQLQLLMLVDDVGPGLDASDDLKIDGSPVITLFTHDEILRVVQDATLLDGEPELMAST